MHTCFLQQLGMTATVLLIPSFLLPLMRVHYMGLAAEFMPKTSQEMFLYKLPWLLWHRDAEYTNKGLLVIGGTVLILQACIIPLVALTFGLARHGQCRTWLCSLYPMMNGLTLALTITHITPALDSISKFLFSSLSLCESLTTQWANRVCQLVARFWRALGAFWCIRYTGCVCGIDLMESR